VNSGVTYGSASTEGSATSATLLHALLAAAHLVGKSHAQHFVVNTSRHNLCFPCRTDTLDSAVVPSKQILASVSRFRVIAMHLAVAKPSLGSSRIASDDGLQ
jgi:hypothetical protein